MSAKLKVGLVLGLVIILVLTMIVGVSAKRGGGHGPNNPNPNRKAGNALPDQDGKGMDRGEPEGDKEEDGGDFNNGCGNEADGDREDDNNGWCGGHPKSTATPEPTTKVVVTATPTVTATATPTSKPTITICWRGTVPEVWDDEGKFLDEKQVIHEDWLQVCWTAKRGHDYYILDWSPLLGHAGGTYSVSIPRDLSPGTYFPQDGELEYQELGTE